MVAISWQNNKRIFNCPARGAVFFAHFLFIVKSGTMKEIICHS